MEEAAAAEGASAEEGAKDVPPQQAEQQAESSHSWDFQLAGLRRRAKMGKAGLHARPAAAGSQEAHEEAAGSPAKSHVSAEQAVYSQNAGALDAKAPVAEKDNTKGKHKQHISSDFEHAADISPGGFNPLDGADSASSAAAEEAEAPHRQPPVTSSPIDPMKCAREVMAEVQRRSTTSNIVAATWIGDPFCKSLCILSFSPRCSHCAFPLGVPSSMCTW